MSKFAATTVSRCRIRVGRFCAALSVVTLLPAAMAVAAVPDPALRRSEQLDTRRIGKLSNEERSVLRIEWRAAASAGDEARTVQEMLDNLRRMEATVAEINRLVGGIRTQKPVAAVVAAEPPEAPGYDPRLMIANIAAACLVALWWYRRRSSAKAAETTPATTTAPGTEPEASPPLADVEDAETITVELAEASRGEPSPSSVPRAATGAAKPEALPTPAAKPASATAAPEAPEPPAAPPAEAGQNIDFLLEDADPEAVARETARLQKLQALNRRKTPERQQETNVEPTLELAGIMLSLGLQQGAAQALIEYTEANPRQALQHWLKLLDIYRSSGNQEEFKEASEKLRQNFNIQAEDWAKENSAETPRLENFSRVAEHVQKIWSRPAECIDYLRHLLEDNREGSRAGFPQPVAEEILLLIAILRETSGANQAAGL